MSVSVEDVTDMQRIHTIGERQISFPCALLSLPPSLPLFPLSLFQQEKGNQVIICINNYQSKRHVNR